MKSTIDWCEPNYVNNIYIAEFWNTLSSIPIILIGLYGWRNHFHLSRLERTMFAMIGLVGVGSLLFHSLLHRYAQALDELPMFAETMLMVYSMKQISARTYRVVFILFITLYLLLNHYATFLIGYGFAMSLSIYSALKILRRPNVRRSYAMNLFVASASVYAVGLTAWVVDLAYCSLFSHIYLHAVWHVLAGLGTYLFALYVVACKNPNGYILDCSFLPTLQLFPPKGLGF